MADAAFMRAQLPGQAVHAAQTQPGQADLGQLSILGQLGVKERHWKVKMILRAILCVLNIVAIGCSGWYAAHGYVYGFYGYYYGSYGEASPSVAGPVVFAISVVWCLCWITIPLVLRPPRPLHPGIAVGLDLVLWMGFAAIGSLFLFAVIYEVEEAGYYYSPYYGSYYESDDSSTARAATAGIADGLAWLNVLFHFMFFVWACVDTARYNRNKYLESNSLVASQLVKDMERRGLITVNDGSGRQHLSTGWVGPPPQVYQQQYHQPQQLPPQQYQQQYQQPYQQQYQPPHHPQQQYQPQQQPQQQYSPQPNHSELSSTTTPQPSQYNPSDQAQDREKEAVTDATVPESQQRSQQ